MFVKEFLKAQNSEKSPPGGNIWKLGHTPENTRQHFIFFHNLQIKERQTQERDRTSFCIALDQYTLQFHDQIFRAFCETSFKNEKLRAELTASYQCISRFSVRLSKVVCLPRKSDARSYEVLHLSRKIILANLKIWCSKMQPFSGNQRPDILTSLMNTSLVLRLPCEMHLCRSSSIVPHCQRCWNCYKTRTYCSLLTRCTIPCASHAERHLNVQKCSGTPGPSFFFNTFDFEMCFSPQRRTLFQHLNFQKCSEPGVLCTFWLRNVLRTTTARNLVCFVHFDFQMCFAPQRRAIFHLSSGQMAPHPPL